MQGIWHKVRGPFRAISCAHHEWERFDIQDAGCLKCGAMHHCQTHLTDNHDCPLAHMLHGEICCTITGFSLPVVRYSADEFTDQYAASKNAGHAHVSTTDTLSDEVHTIVEWFLLGSASRACKEDEVDRTLARCSAHVVKSLKQHKMETAGEDRRSLPCIPTILAQTMHHVRPRHCTTASAEMCAFCSQHITKCLVNLNIPCAQQAKRVSTVVGLLYLMKQGLTIQNVQWLPRVPSLVNCLPHETCLEKTFKLSMKLVCETENEVKLALRQRVKLL
jgi:hypothetical protein